MGTWGVGPFDNDGAADMISGLVKPVEIVETRRSNDSAQNYYNEARAAAQFLLLSHGTDILGGPGLLQVVRAIARIRSDAEWISHFRSPGTCMAQLDQELDAVLQRMQQCKGCKEYRREAAKIVDGARKITMADVEGEVIKRPKRPRGTRAKDKTRKIHSLRQRFARSTPGPTRHSTFATR